MNFRHARSVTGGGSRPPAEPAAVRPAALPPLKDPETEPVRQAAYAAHRAEASRLDAVLDYAEAYLGRVEAEAEERRAAAAAGESVALLDAALERSAMCMYLAQALSMSENQVSVMIEEGRFTREHLPATWAGLHAGAVGMRHVTRIVEAARKLRNPAKLPELDRQATAYAATHRMGQLSAWLRRWIAAAEPQEHAARCAMKLRDRRVWVEQGEEGTSLLCAELPTMTAERIVRRLRAVAVSSEQPVPRNPEVVSAVEGVESVYPDLPQTRTDGDERTLAQREADMLAAWLLNGQTEAGIPIDAHIGVLISADSLTGASQQPAVTRDRKTPISAAALRGITQDPSSEIRWHEVHHQPPPDPRSTETDSAEPVEDSTAGTAAKGAGPSRTAASPESPPAQTRAPAGLTSPAQAPFPTRTPFPASDGDVLAHVYTGRFVPKLLKEAISFRDGICAAEGCGTPAENCDMDHVIPWPTGQTTGNNIEPLCRRHHRLKTAGHHVTPELHADAITTSYSRAA